MMLQTPLPQTALAHTTLWHAAPLWHTPLWHATVSTQMPDLPPTTSVSSSSFSVRSVSFDSTSFFGSSIMPPSPRWAVSLDGHRLPTLRHCCLICIRARVRRATRRFPELRAALGNQH